MRRPSPASLIALAALFVALCGTAQAHAHRFRHAAKVYISTGSAVDPHVGRCHRVARREPDEDTCRVSFIDPADVTDNGQAIAATYTGRVLVRRLRPGRFVCTFDPLAFAWEHC